MNEERLIATAIIVVGGIGLTFARRWNNTDNEVGIGIAGWTIVILFLMWA